jgi:type II secretory pathway pseudopilin PulG
MMNAMRAIPKTPRINPWSAPGFTLVEMLIVISLIILLATTAVPSFVGLFEAGTATQAYNILSSQLSAARAYAMERGTFAGVHIQRADAVNANLGLPKTNVCYSAIVAWDGGSLGNLVGVAGFEVRRMPGHMGFGDVDKLGAADFTTVTILFSRTGGLVRKLNGQQVRIAGGDPLLMLPTALWSPNRGGGATLADPAKAVYMFDLAQRDMVSDKSAYVTRNSQIMAINVNTGLLFPRR